MHVLSAFLCFLNGQRFKVRVFIAPYVVFCTVSLKREVSPVVSSHHTLRQSVLGRVLRSGDIANDTRSGAPMSVGCLFRPGHSRAAIEDSDKP